MLAAGAPVLEQIRSEKKQENRGETLMLFKPELIEKIVSNQKTQTRRLCKPTEQPVWNPKNLKEIMLVQSGKRTKWEVGRSYAVQCKRGGKGVWFSSDGWSTGKIYTFSKPLRIKITRIRQMKLKQTTGNDARAEGFNSKQEFWEYFYHVNGDLKPNEDLLGAVIWFEKKLPDLPVWALSFEVE